MPRIARLVLPGLPHHVVLRGNNRRRLFSYPNEYRYFLFLLGRALARSRCTLQALVLMRNHIHMILTPSDDKSLARCVGYLAQRYAQVRNRRRKSSGGLFEGRFFSRPIPNDRQLAITTAYIDLNPLRAGIAPADRPYRWSTEALHLGRPELSEIPSGLWTPSDWYLALAPDRATRGPQYAEWFEECQLSKEEPEWIDLVALKREMQDDQLRFERPDRSCAL